MPNPLPRVTYSNISEDFTSVHDRMDLALAELLMAGPRHARSWVEGGSADQRYEFVVVHEFMHIATSSFFFPGPRDGWPRADSHNEWAALLGVDAQQLRNIETQKPTPSGAGELVADCLTWSLTGFTTEEYWQTWVGGGSCSRNSAAVGTTQRIRDELFG